MSSAENFNRHAKKYKNKKKKKKKKKKKHFTWAMLIKSLLQNSEIYNLL